MSGGFICCDDIVTGLDKITGVGGLSGGVIDLEHAQVSLAL